MQISPTEVLIVGAGPTGLTLAGELLRRGSACRLFEQATAPATTLLIAIKEEMCS